jgi:hypothetical protein
MVSFTEYKRQGKFKFPNPGSVISVSSYELKQNIDNNLQTEVKEAEKVADELLTSKVKVSDSFSEESTSINTEGTSQNLVSNLEFNQYLDKLYSSFNDSLINNILNFFQPVEVSGHLDSLLGVQLVLYFSIFIMAISVSILLVLHLLVNIFILNKDRILNHFNNKIVRFYIKYQTILAYIS